MYNNHNVNVEIYMCVYMYIFVLRTCRKAIGKEVPKICWLLTAFMEWINTVVFQGEEGSEE